MTEMHPAPLPPERRMRRSAAAASIVALALGLVGLTGAVSASAATTSPGAPGAREITKPVTYHGYTFQVPAAWPVISLTANPHECVLFDRHAVYLGTPAANENCPASGAGRATEALLIQPAAASAAASSVQDPVAQRIAASKPRIRVTASYGSHPGLVRQILASASLPAPVSSTLHPAPVTRSPAAPLTASAIKALSTTNDTGEGFDACTAPSSGNMNAWRADSPYRAVGIYIGGSERACAQPNLTSAWVSAEASAGWAFIPIYVGPQAEFGQLTSPASQGTASADGAVSAAESLGIRPGATLYYDMEAFPSSQNGNVISFVSAWTTELHRLQYLSGVYSSSDSGVTVLGGSFTNPSYSPPDVIYDALWNGAANTSDSNIPSRAWAYHQRVHQFNGGVNQTYGGYTLNIDQDYLNVVEPYGKSEQAATVDSTGTVRVFVRGTNRAIYTDALPAGKGWTGFANLGGNWPADPAVVSEAGGKVQVFAIGTTAALYVDTLSGSTWSGWKSLGGIAQGTPRVVNAGGTIRVFVRAASGGLYVNSMSSSGAWSGFTALGGNWTDDVAAIAETNGNVQVLAVGNTGNLYADTLSGSSWSGWADLGGGCEGVPAVVEDHTSTVRVFIRGNAGGLYENALKLGGKWSGFLSLGGRSRDNPGAVVSSAGTVLLFVTGTTSALYVDQLPSGGSWSGWKSLGTSVTGAPAVVQDTKGVIRSYTRGTGANLEETYSSGSSWPNDSRGGVLY